MWAVKEERSQGRARRRRIWVERTGECEPLIPRAKLLFYPDTESLRSSRDSNSHIDRDGSCAQAWSTADLWAWDGAEGMVSESDLELPSLFHRNCSGQWLRGVEKCIGYFVVNVDFCGWTRNLATSCGEQHGKFLA